MSSTHKSEKNENLEKCKPREFKDKKLIMLMNTRLT